MTERDDDRPFYVGYLPLPGGLRLPVLLIAACFLAVNAIAALLLVHGQPAPSGGAWGTDGEVQLDGRFVAHPYPLLRVAGADGIRTVLLVSEGKNGAGDGLEDFDGMHVSVAGYPIIRGDLTVLQLDRAPEAAPGAGPAVPPESPPTDATLTGEIVDAKCWAGAMVPGDGKTHKGCGSLCLLGDIPALFIAEAGDGAAHWYLLGSTANAPLGEAARAHVGERVTLSGTVRSGPGLARFEVDPATLENPQ